MRVLLANDQSPRAVDAAHLLVRLPLAKPVDVTVMSVVEVPSLPESVESHARWPEVLDLMLKDAESSNAKVAGSLDASAGSIESLVCRGDAAEEIVAAAISNKTDLLVLGALGRSAFDRMTLGSVSDQAATHAECSTLIVRPSWTDTPDERSLKVVVAYDASEPAKYALEQVAKLNWTKEVEITLLQVVTQLTTPYYYGFAADMPGLWQEEYEASERRLNAVAAPLRDRGFTVSTDIRTADHHGEEICRRIRELAADVVVVGDHGYGGLKRFLLGSVSRYVLRHSKASVWIHRMVSHDAKSS
jgi:nucleotide-binding universal stress UspA family protein